MWVEIVLIAILLIICVLEAAILLKDEGIVASLAESAKSMIRSNGWLPTTKAAFSMVAGKMNDCIRIFVKRKNTDECIHVAVRPIGGLGDYIISKKILEELSDMASVKITVFCEVLSYGYAVYGNESNVSVEQYKNFERERRGYDLALQIGHFVQVKNCDKERIRRLEPELFRSITYIVENWNDLYVHIWKRCYMERIQFERCRILGLNRWTELRMGKAFRISEKKVKIGLSQTHYEQWSDLGLADKKYLTFNYGADKMRKDRMQIKVWPKEYYEKLIQLVKEKNESIEIIQLGDRGAEKIIGADRYLLGEDLELVKWVLKNSSCHIDCEGGLVHMATQLGTICAVIFGPTLFHMYAYEQNINFVSRRCHGCMGTSEDWAYQCYRKISKPVCMYDVLPERVYEGIKSKVAEVI